MNNDITTMAQLVSKAKASVFTMEYISHFEASDIDSDDVDLRFEVDGVETGTSVSIVDECGQAAQMIRALVEALEKAQAQSSKWLEAYHKAVSVGARYEESIAELELAVKAKQAALSLESAHLHVRQRRLEAVEDKILKMAKLLTDIKNSRPGGVYFIKWEDKINEMLKDADISELESRTVTVKLPDINEYLAEVHDKTLALAFRRLAEGVRDGDIFALRAAGIQVIEGEA